MLLIIDMHRCKPPTQPGPERDIARSAWCFSVFFLLRTGIVGKRNPGNASSDEKRFWTKWERRAGMHVLGAEQEKEGVRGVGWVVTGSAEL